MTDKQRIAIIFTEAVCLQHRLADLAAATGRLVLEISRLHDTLWKEEGDEQKHDRQP